MTAVDGGFTTAARERVSFGPGAQDLDFAQPTKIACSVPLDASCFPKAEADFGWPGAFTAAVAFVCVAYVIGAIAKAMR